MCRFFLCLFRYILLAVSLPDIKQIDCEAHSFPFLSIYRITLFGSSIVWMLDSITVCPTLCISFILKHQCFFSPSFIYINPEWVFALIHMLYGCVDESAVGVVLLTENLQVKTRRLRVGALCCRLIQNNK